MKKYLNYLSTAAIILGIISLVVSAFFFVAYKTTLDGDYSLYRMQKRMTLICLIIGIAFTAAGIVAIIIKRK